LRITSNPSNKTLTTKSIHACCYVAGVLTHAATERFNDLAEKFEANGREFETVAREVTVGEFELIAKSYGFDEIIEELIASRDW